MTTQQLIMCSLVCKKMEPITASIDVAECWWSDEQHKTTTEIINWSKLIWIWNSISYLVLFLNICYVPCLWCDAPTWSVHEWWWCDVYRQSKFYTHLLERTRIFLPQPVRVRRGCGRGRGRGEGCYFVFLSNIYQFFTLSSKMILVCLSEHAIKRYWCFQ